jgi:hypothetical protein
MGEPSSGRGSEGARFMVWSTSQLRATRNKDTKTINDTTESTSDSFLEAPHDGCQETDMDSMLHWEVVLPHNVEGSMHGSPPYSVHVLSFSPSKMGQ